MTVVLCLSLEDETILNVLPKHYHVVLLLRLRRIQPNQGQPNMFDKVQLPKTMFFLSGLYDRKIITFFYEYKCKRVSLLVIKNFSLIYLIIRVIFQLRYEESLT